ncbi:MULTISPECIES: 2,3-diaminopropionate biosynthesis protein SbnA [unclassified Streptomyces]|uniref:2,3-diaminopropionate biosynthesis protein SbnA n=1 Tax=unclassified Streptomyces TaxID=2593676 RepID=UPI000DC75AD3|nr:MULTISPECIES: 2,3-diaminopropionate biosynthesis protein SbnA [unclassified Streptomyces]AWZ04402.1 2,3-diaminopropionate biosynthesis protein SbnA [Streptomyces sp. ICC4]AWZ12082.1 2,3-diaminopropionate biosynthesis protein SbnA [Streptomyces sp. ICC1]
MIHNSITDCIGATPLVRLGRLFPQHGIEVLAKLEMLNPGGSVKDRSARYIVERGIRDGMIRRGTRIVESTSGNFGVALAMVAVRYGLRFTAVVDPNASRTNLRILRQYGAEIEMVSEPDHAGGYLHTRLARVQDLLADDSDAVWINQYANELNWETHAVTTAREVIEDCPEPVDVLVAAVSTTGTLHGLARGLRREWPALKVVAVDAVGSVIFGTPPGPRMLPGVGSSRVPELLTPGEIDQVVHIDDAAAIHGCHRLLRHEAIFAGGSSGSVVAAIEELLPELPRPSRILTLLADRGERYLDLVYTDEMAIEHDELAYSSHS